CSGPLLQCSVSPVPSLAAPSPTQSCTLSLHDALPIYLRHGTIVRGVLAPGIGQAGLGFPVVSQLVAAAEFGTGDAGIDVGGDGRSEEHTSELQSRENLVCRLLLEKKNKAKKGGPHNRW